MASSLLLAVALTGFVIEAGQAEQGGGIQSYTEAEKLREEVYALFYSGAMAQIKERGANEFPVDLGNVTISSGELEGNCAYFIIYADGGIGKFTVSRKG